MRKLKILQLASFEGNIGDNANHCGTRSTLAKNLGVELEFTNLEIREFYWKQRKFDDQFAELANQHDLVMIGGGNYFEMWVENSCTGTSIDISIDLLKKINTPIVFYALGCDPGQGVSEQNVSKFRDFLDYVLSLPQFLVSVRNDGSWDSVNQYIGKKYAERIYRVPDGGFFTQVENYFHPELPLGKQVVAVNIAGDMLDVRFKLDGISSKRIRYEEFIIDFSQFVNDSLESNSELHFIFIPHIFRDIGVVSDILNAVNDSYRRNRITMAPYLHGKGAQEYIFDLYRKCDLVLGMRFHANVCPIGFNVPTIGLVNYIQIDNLYRELDLSERSVHVNEAGFSHKLNDMTRASLKNKEDIVKKYKEINMGLQQKINFFHKVMAEWINC
ncbi:polysaccharide pyruvyl transferase family protein [Sporomusa silvacetica]|nr:polysaccharide pyruvyl transferase family protein [Sporomusa silvacetica]